MSRLAGQTISDRLLAAKHSIAGQGLAKSVCKATTEEMIGPKKKHLDYLVHCTNEPNVSIPQLANLLIERSQNTNWVVVYKALVTVHHMMCYGNERFTQYLASSNSTFQLSNFLDKSGVQGILYARTGYDMSPFIRRYARYLNEKAMSYRTVAFDFCKVKRGKEDGMLRTMNTDKLIKTLPVLQLQLDALLEFDCSANDLTNGVINMCFMLLFRDIIRLFACYNDGIINLLEKYFDMNKKQCKEGLDIYKKFLVRMDKVNEFFKVAENVGIDKGDIPDLTKAPSSLLDALEQHYNNMDGKKITNPTNANQKNIKSGVTALSTISNSFGNIVANGRFDQTANGGSSGNIDENLKLQVLAEEEAAMNQFKSKISPTNNPFLNLKTNEIDLFQNESISNNKGTDDLLQLSNPFSDVFPNSMLQSNAWMSNGNSFGQTASPLPQNPIPIQPAVNGGFVNENNFASVFGNADVKNLSGFDALGGVLQPMTTNQTLPTINNTTVTNGTSTNGSALLTGDLETSLASLAENLTINTRAVPVKSVQWNSPKNGSKTINWTPQPMSATTGAGYKPMNQSMNQTTFTTAQTIMQPVQMYSQFQPMMGIRPIVTNPTMIPQMGIVPNPSNQVGQSSLLFH